MTGLRLLVGTTQSRLSQRHGLAGALSDLGAECRLVVGTDVVRGFPSRSISDWLSGTGRFKRLISEFGPDLILSNMQRHFELAATREKIPLLMHLRGNYWKEMKIVRGTTYSSIHRRVALYWWQRIGARCLAGSAMILPICRHLESVVRDTMPGKRTAVMYNGIDPSMWYPEEGMSLKHPCVGLIQNANYRDKAAEMLLLADIMDRFPGVTFYWAGDGPLAPQILSRLQRHPNFEWLGRLDHPGGVRRFLSEIDVYLLVSGMDMAPTSLLEAQAMRRPVVATAVGGVPEIMEGGKSGFLVRRGDLVDIAEKLSRILEDPGRSSAMGIHGRSFVTEKFGWDAVAGKLLRDIESYTGAGHS